MSDLYSCPTCQTTLRAPAGVSTIRCPKCKTVLTIVSNVAEAPPLPFAPPPAKAKAAPGSKPQPPAGPSSVAKSSPPSPDELEVAEKKKKLKKELAEHEAQKARKERRAKQLNHHCRIGRFATDLLKYAVRAQALAVALEVIVMIVFIVGFVAAVASAVTGKAGANVILGAGLGLTVRILLPLALLLSIASILALIAGFGYAMAGPKPARHISLLGLISGVLHLGVAAAQAVVAIRILTQGQFQVDPTQPIWQQAQPVFDLFGLVTDMPLLSEHPARFIWNYKVSWLGIIAGALEFVRLVSICLMAQIYAEEGKAPETGHRALKAAYRVFWLMLLAGLFRVAAAFAFDWVRPDDAFMQFVGLIVHGLITFGITMGLAISLYSLSNLLDDIRDLVDPVRFAATGEIYEF